MSPIHSQAPTQAALRMPMPMPVPEPMPAPMPMPMPVPMPMPAHTLVQLTGNGGGGVRDYLACLQAAWAARGRSTEVLALSETLVGQASLATRLLQCAGDGPCTLLLHFSGYGFHPRGLCQWLAREVEDARRVMGPRLRVVTMFHELFASGPPWGSAFWLSRVQAGIAARVARASDAVWTNSQHHAQWLQPKTRPGTPLHVRPVFSTIGEPQAVPPTALRQRRLVVFGSASTRARALQALPRHAATLRAQGITELLEVGSGASAAWHHPALQHRHLGHLDETALHQLLASSAYALIDYPSIHLGKSTVFAAYAVHGCVVLNTAAPGPDADGLLAGLHHHTLGQTGSLWHAEPQGMASAARQWYAQHTLAVQAREFAQLCGLHFEEDLVHAR